MPTINWPAGSELWTPTKTLLRDIERASGDITSKSRTYVDVETKYGTKYTLRQQNYTEYIRDPRFELMCASVAIDSAPVMKMTKPEFDEFARQHNWHETTVIAHNTMFDGLILAEKYGVRPAKWHCTLSLVRALFQGSIDADIDSMATFLGLPGKSGILPKVKDRGWNDLTPAEQEAMLDYCANDTTVCRTIDEVFTPALPEKERELLHMTLQQFLEPKLFLDLPKLAELLEETKAGRQRLIIASGVEPQGKKTAEDRLRSSREFAKILTAQGVETPTKWSKKQEKDIEAFSKTDLPWLRLVQTWRETGQTHLVALAEARMNCASSTHITRPARLALMGANNRPVGAAYNYFGAHSGRWSGGNKLNFQNFKRKGKIRKSIVAPKGYVLVVADSSQIELRFNAWFNDERWMLDTLRRGECIYRRAAGIIYGIEHWMGLDKDSPERFVGKVSELGLGYGMSGPKFNDTLALGAMGPPIFMTQAQTNHIVYEVYRPSHANIVSGWNYLGQMLHHMQDKRCKVDKKCVEFRHEGIVLPNGTRLVYHGLHQDPDENLVYFANGAWHKIYGGLTDENIIQGLARVGVSENMLEIKRELPIVMHTHDEIVALAKEQEADAALAFMIDVMSRPPSWAPDIPLAAEGGYDYCYSK